MSFQRASSQFAEARRILMLPHPHGEAESISRAFGEIDMGLENLDQSKLDESAKKWLAELVDLMNSKDIEVNTEEGRYLSKAKTLGTDDLSTLSQLVDDLQYFFDEQARKQ